MTRLQKVRPWRGPGYPVEVISTGVKVRNINTRSMPSLIRIVQLLTTYFIIYNHSLFDFLIVCVYYLIAELHVKEKSLFHCLALSIGKNGTTFLTKKDCTEKLPFLCEKGIIDGELNREYTERMEKIVNQAVLY